MSTEFLDIPKFSGEAYERTFVAYLREKYATHPPEVIIVAAEEALGFMLRNRAQLFPRAPVVHMSVSSTYLQSIPPLPPDVIGIPLNFDFVRHRRAGIALASDRAPPCRRDGHERMGP